MERETENITRFFCGCQREGIKASQIYGLATTHTKIQQLLQDGKNVTSFSLMTATFHLSLFETYKTESVENFLWHQKKKRVNKFVLYIVTW